MMRRYRRGETYSGRVPDEIYDQIQVLVAEERRDELVDMLHRYRRVRFVGAVSEALANAYPDQRSFVWDTLMWFRRHPRASVRSVWTLGLIGERYVGYRRVLPYIKELVDDTADDLSREVRENACRGLIQLLINRYREQEFSEGDPLYRELVKWRRHPSVNIRGAVVSSMCFSLAHRESIPRVLTFIEPLLADREPRVRKRLGPFLISRLGLKRPTAVLEKLREWAESPDEVVRWNVAMSFSSSFGRNRPREALEILEPLARDHRRFVWRPVVSALKEVGRRHPGRVTTAIEKWLGDPVLGRVAELALEYIYNGPGESMA